MDAVKTWCTLVCSATIICSIIEFLIPPGKISKSINIVLSSFMLCCIILPFSSKSKFKKIDFNNIFKEKNKNSEKTKNNISEQALIIAQKNIESIIKGLLKDNNIFFEKVEIFMDRNADNCILMIRCKIYIPKNSKPNIEKIKSEVENKLNIKTEIICE